MTLRFLHSARFWLFFLVTFAVTGGFFSWELGFLSSIGIDGPARTPATSFELAMTFFITFLLGLNVGLFAWQKRYGSCPRGVRRASGIASFTGVIALFCPVCTVGSLGFLGVSIGLGFISPFVPLLQMIAVVLLLASAFLLSPRSK